MTEAELQAAVIEMAHLYEWRVAHFRPARNLRGDWFTPVAADGKGFPDLCLAHHEKGVIFAELKSKSGRVTAEQAVWIETLQMAGAHAFVWRPEDWTDGFIQEVLEEGPNE